MGNIKVRFWGVRGARAVSNLDTIKYGGNTSCIEVEIGDKRLILDAGTGICDLGRKLLGMSPGLESHIFISHWHWDHVIGFPMFEPIRVKGNVTNVYGQVKADMDIENLFSRLFSYPYFPIVYSDIREGVNLLEIDEKSIVEIDGIKVTTMASPHPGGSLSFKISYGEKILVYLGDGEYFVDRHGEILDFIRGADLVIYDSFFFDEEYYGLTDNKEKKGMGHSTWQEGAKFMKASGALKLVLTHHAPYRSDAAIDERIETLGIRYPGLIVAREGMTIII